MKNKFKFTTLFFAILIMISSFCFATQEQTPIEPRTSEVEQINVTDEAVTTNLENESEEAEKQEPEIHKGDLYIFEDSVNMDKLVDGNVYIIGKNVNITGQIAGNLFVIADTLTIGDDTSSTSYNGYVYYNIYALANKATLYSSCNDLYIAGNDITIEDSFYLFRDLKMGATNANVYALIRRNVDAEVGTLNLKKDDGTHASIYGNLTYSSPNQLDEETLKTCVSKETNYNPITENSSSTKEKVTVMTHLENAAIKVIFTVFVWLLILWITPKFVEKSPKLITNKPLKTLGSGLLALIATPFICFLLLILIITMPISLIGIILYVFAISIALSITCIGITYSFKEKLNLNTWYKTLGLLILVRIALYLIKLIPFVGGLISFITLILGLGLITLSIKTDKIKENKSEVVIEEKAE